ncbi:hypothetical protein ASD54_04370 [Rhizobium sp. Root149]|jgi:hypothetical protein|nr:hypothetical protein ASD54_04370 [Rhizobium sp. Root149]
MHQVLFPLSVFSGGQHHDIAHEGLGGRHFENGGKGPVLPQKIRVRIIAETPHISYPEVLALPERLL